MVCQMKILDGFNVIFFFIYIFLSLILAVQIFVYGGIVSIKSYNGLMSECPAMPSCYI